MRPSRRGRGRAAPEPAELERERDQPLLGAVVEVALQPLPLLLSRLDHPPARAAQLLEAGLQLDVQPAVLERDGGRRADRVEQLGLVVERGVVHQRRHVLPSRSIRVVARPSPASGS